MTLLREHTGDFSTVEFPVKQTVALLSVCRMRGIGRGQSICLYIIPERLGFPKHRKGQEVSGRETFAFETLPKNCNALTMHLPCTCHALAMETGSKSSFPAIWDLQVCRSCRMPSCRLFNQSPTGSVRLRPKFATLGSRHKASYHIVSPKLTAGLMGAVCHRTFSLVERRQ